MDLELFKEFFKLFPQSLGANLHVGEHLWR